MLVATVGQERASCKCWTGKELVASVGQEKC